MSLLLLAYIGGALTILSPCILPVLPFVFARAGQPFVRSTLPMLAGMALTFAAVATLASVGGAWVVQANQYGRYAALVLLALFGLSLLLPTVAERLMQPVVALGNRLAGASDTSTVWRSLLLGVATGMLWAPCAGPILGLVLTGAALNGASVQTSLLLVAYAAGAASSLAVALGIGGRVFAAMKRSIGAGEWLRRGLGVGVLAGVAVIAAGADTGLLARLSAGSTNGLEQALLNAVDKARAKPKMPETAPQANLGSDAMLLAASDTRVGFPTSAPLRLPVEGRLPALDGAVQWINSAPVTREQLQGKVTLVYFWTYSCINCIRSLPYLRAWADKYKDQGLTVIGVHTPEFAFEKQPDNVRRAIADFRIGFPVAVDSDYKIWRAFNNSYWPAAYFVDGRGNIRHHQFGEGDYANSERVIQALLAEQGGQALPVSRDLVTPDARGAQAMPDLYNVRSPETYIGYEQGTNFASPGGVRPDVPRDYTIGKPRLNGWGLAGRWTVGAEQATLDQPNGGIVYTFHARDLHLVLGPAADGRAVRFQVSIDGKPPGASHGADIDAGGNGAVTQTRLYQLVRQAGEVGEHTFEIRFLDPGVRAYAFTFG